MSILLLVSSSHAFLTCPAVHSSTLQHAFLTCPVKRIGSPDAPDLEGLIPPSLEQIFQTSHQSLKDQGWKYKMQASILEIYNETIRDLLSNRPDTNRQ
ncbi:hypothetical protein HN51_009685 [Arachis hypogaea]